MPLSGTFCHFDGGVSGVWVIQFDLRKVQFYKFVNTMNKKKTVRLKRAVSAFFDGYYKHSVSVCRPSPSMVSVIEGRDGRLYGRAHVARPRGRHICLYVRRYKDGFYVSGKDPAEGHEWPILGSSFYVPSGPKAQAVFNRGVEGHCSYVDGLDHLPHLDGGAARS